MIYFNRNCNYVTDPWPVGSEKKTSKLIMIGNEFIKYVSYHF